MPTQTATAITAKDLRVNNIIRITSKDHVGNLSVDKQIVFDRVSRICSIGFLGVSIQNNNGFNYTPEWKFEDLYPIELSP